MYLLLIVFYYITLFISSTVKYNINNNKTFKFQSNNEKASLVVLECWIVTPTSESE